MVIKVIIGVNLISYATRRRAGMEAREAEDAVNDWGRDPVGEGKEERVRFSCNQALVSSSYHHSSNTIVNSRPDWTAIRTTYCRQRRLVKIPRKMVGKVQEGRGRKGEYHWKS